MSQQESRIEGRGAVLELTRPQTPRTGSLTFEGDYARITFVRRLQHPADRVWEMLTEPEHLAQWFMTKARIDPREGGSIEFWSGPAQLHVTGKIRTWDPPRLFEHEWNLEPRKDFPKGETSIVRWELTPEGDGTLLRITHRRLTRRTATGFVGGLHGFLDRLEDQLEGAPLTDWPRRVGEVRPNYPEPWSEG